MKRTIMAILCLICMAKLSHAGNLGTFTNGNGTTRDTVRIDFITWDTLANNADADTFFIRRWYRGALVDSTFGTASTNKVRTGFYSVPKMAASSNGIGQYKAEIEFHKWTKSYKQIDFYTVIPRWDSTITTNNVGISDGAIKASTFAQGAIDSAALNGTAATKVNAPLATLAQVDSTSRYADSTVVPKVVVKGVTNGVGIADGAIKSTTFANNSITSAALESNIFDSTKFANNTFTGKAFKNNFWHNIAVFSDSGVGGPATIDWTSFLRLSIKDTDYVYGQVGDFVKQGGDTALYANTHELLDSIFMADTTNRTPAGSFGRKIVQGGTAAISFSDIVNPVYASPESAGTFGYFVLHGGDPDSFPTAGELAKVVRDSSAIDTAAVYRMAAKVMYDSTASIASVGVMVDSIGQNKADSTNCLSMSNDVIGSDQIKTGAIDSLEIAMKVINEIKRAVWTDSTGNYVRNPYMEFDKLDSTKWYVNGTGNYGISADIGNPSADGTTLYDSLSNITTSSTDTTQIKTMLNNYYKLLVRMNKIDSIIWSVGYPASYVGENASSIQNQLGGFSKTDNAKGKIDSLLDATGYPGVSLVGRPVDNISSKIGPYSAVGSDNVKTAIENVTLGTCGGVGTEACTLYAMSGIATPISNVMIEVKNLAQTSMAGGPLFTDMNGKQIFMLNPNQYVAILTSEFFNTLVDTITVTQDSSWHLAMTGLTIPVSTDAAKCNVYVDTKDICGSKAVGAKFTVVPIVGGYRDWHTTTGIYIMPVEKSAIADTSGRATIEIYRSSSLINSKGDSIRYDFHINYQNKWTSDILKRTVPDSSSWKVR